MRDYNPHCGVPSRPTPNSGRISTVLMLLAIVATYALVHQWDENARLEQQFIQAQLAHTADLSDTEREWAAKVAQAYRAGQRDAIANLSARDGMALAQACQAWKYRDQADGQDVAGLQPVQSRKGA